MFKLLTCLTFVVACTFRATTAATSAYSPHTPSAPPWFEGWYIRVQADDSSAAFGIGHYPDQQTDKPRAACFLVHRDNQPQGRTLEDHFYMPHNLDVTTHPDRCSEGPRTCMPSFRLAAAHSDSSSCQLAFDDDAVHVQYRSGRYTFNMTFPNRADEIVPWSPHQLSPMGWLSRPPFSALLKLQWFVHSLRTPAVYSLEDHRAGASRRDIPGHVHLEKNWGTGFPTSWLWSQGQGTAHVTPATAADGAAAVPAAYVLAGGHVPHAFDRLFLPQLFTFSFHSPRINVTVDANHPPVWERVVDVSGCRGTAELTLRSWHHVVRLSIRAAPQDFAEVTCPNSDGFMDLAVEAFSATTDIQIFTTRGLLADPGELLVEASFQRAALEFGGTYRCQGAGKQSEAQDSRQDAESLQPEAVLLADEL